MINIKTIVGKGVARDIVVVGSEEYTINVVRNVVIRDVVVAGILEAYAPSVVRDVVASDVVVAGIIENIDAIIIVRTDVVT